MIFRHMERELKLDMEDKENLKGFSAGGEPGWYGTPLHFQTKILFLNDSFYIFLYFIFWQHPAFVSQREKQSASQNLQEFCESGKPSSFFRSRWLSTSNKACAPIIVSIKFPVSTGWQLVVQKAEVFPHSRAQQESCKVRCYYQHITSQ